MDIQAPLVYHLRHLLIAEWVGKIPAHTQQDDFRLVVTPFKEVGLGHVDRSARDTSFSAYHLPRFLQHNRKGCSRACPHSLVCLSHLMRIKIQELVDDW